jgi:hypothetical protein
LTSFKNNKNLSKESSGYFFFVLHFNIIKLKMKKLIIITTVISISFFSCKKNSSNRNSSTGTATVTFTNPIRGDVRLLLTSVSDTLYPFNNYVLDVNVPGNGSVTRSDITAGKRKMIGFIACAAGQPITIACTTYVYKTVEYQANQTYTEPIR